MTRDGKQTTEMPLGVAEYEGVPLRGMGPRGIAPGLTTGG